jgi:hypothetical protein
MLRDSSNPENIGRRCTTRQKSVEYKTENSIKSVKFFSTLKSISDIKSWRTLYNTVQAEHHLDEIYANIRSKIEEKAHAWFIRLGKECARLRPRSSCSQVSGSCRMEGSDIGGIETIATRQDTRDGEHNPPREC